jgi:hypothetical protein
MMVIEEGEKVKNKGLGTCEQNNSRNCSKSQKSDAHPSTGGL